MPAIRDWVWTYHSSTSGTSITIDVPRHQPGDLLLAILSTDTGTQTWSCPGWTVLFSHTNNANLAVAYKIASNNEPPRYTFTYSVSETANASIFSVMDVDTVSPIAGYQAINFTASRVAMPRVSVLRPYSLVFYIATHGSTAVQPSIIEGPVTFVYSNDGAAHADAVSWGFVFFDSVTPDNVYCSVSGTTYNGVLATVVINPPETGAKIIPPCCVEDNCIYVDPIHGTTAFRGNSAFSGSVTTYWSSPLAGRSLANATVTTRADYGINPYRSAGGMTGPTTADTYQGAVLVLSDANRVDIRGKNVLVHAMPYLPVDIQTVYDAGLGKGIEFGIASSANNGIVWHVHGANTPFGIRRVPIVVNPDNVSGRIDVRGNPDFSVAKIFGFFTCGFLVSSDWVWSMIWVMGNTVICGGCEDMPIDLESISYLCGYGHERMSILYQGKGQAIFYQEVQIGNGNYPTYLKLENTSIEFPEIYNLEKRLTQYCSVPNKVGIMYYAGPNDVIIHRNSIISSGSKYYWKIHPNSSPNATYDFRGLQVIGAGDIYVPSGLVIEGVTFSSCDKVNPNGSVFRDCIFEKSTDPEGALFVNSSFDMSKVVSCEFRNNPVAICLASPSPDVYTFEDLWFYDNQVDVLVKATSGKVVINVVGGGNLDPSKVVSLGAEVEVNNVKRLIISGLKPGSEVRIYDSETWEELGGIEESGTEFVFEYNYQSDRYVDIVVHHLNYIYVRICNYLLPDVDTVLPISQQIDRQYANP